VDSQDLNTVCPAVGTGRKVIALARLAESFTPVAMGGGSRSVESRIQEIRRLL